MEIYIEYVIVDNLVIDAVLLILMQKFTNDAVIWWRILIASLVGTLFSVFTPQISLNSDIYLLAKILISLLMVSLARFSFKSMFRATMIFYLLTFTFGGVIIGLFYLVKIDFSTTNGLYYLLDFPIGILIAGFFISILIVTKGYKFGRKRRNIATYLYPVEIFNKGKTKKLIGFLDSGNFLTDRVSGKPVLVTSIKSVMNLIENIDFSTLDKMKCSSISSKTEVLRLFEVEKFVIYDDKKLNIHNNVLLGLSYRPVSNENNFDLLLNKDLFEE